LFLPDLIHSATVLSKSEEALESRNRRARTDKGDRHPYLERNDAYDLVLRSVKAYRGHHGQTSKARQESFCEPTALRRRHAGSRRENLRKAIMSWRLNAVG
jgi:hypothetical protein